METIKAPNYNQFKDINGQLFEMQTRILLSDSIIDELEAKIGMANEEIRHLERLESELMGQEKDLDEGIAQDMESYAEVLAANLKLQWADHFAEESSAEDDDQRVVTRYLSTLENDSQDLEVNHDKNSIVKELKEAEEEISRLENVLLKHDASLRKAMAEQMKEAGPVIGKRNLAIIGLVQTWKKRQILNANQAELKKKYVELQEENKRLSLQVQAMASEQASDPGEGISRTADPSIPLLANMTNQMEETRSPEIVSSSSQDQSFESDEMDNAKGQRDEPPSNDKTRVTRGPTDLIGRRPIVQTSSKDDGPPQNDPARKRTDLIQRSGAEHDGSSKVRGRERNGQQKKVPSPPTKKREEDELPQGRYPALQRPVHPSVRFQNRPDPRDPPPKPKVNDGSPQGHDRGRIEASPRKSPRGKIAERPKDSSMNIKRPSPSKKATSKGKASPSPEIARNRDDSSPPQKRAKLTDRNLKKVPLKQNTTEDIADQSNSNETIEETPTSPPTEKDQSMVDLDLDQEFDTIGSVSSRDFASPQPDGSFFGGGASVAGDDDGDDWF